MCFPSLGSRSLRSIRSLPAWTLQHTLDSQPCFSIMAQGHFIHEEVKSFVSTRRGGVVIPDATGSVCSSCQWPRPCCRSVHSALLPGCSSAGHRTLRSRQQIPTEISNLFPGRLRTTEDREACVSTNRIYTSTAEELCHSPCASEKVRLQGNFLE